VSTASMSQYAIGWPIVCEPGELVRLCWCEDLVTKLSQLRMGLLLSYSPSSGSTEGYAIL
jgi:hypothetical protein